MRRSATCRRPSNRGCTVRALVARYYDATTGTFLTRDPIEPVTQQPYQYAQEDPLDQTDPSGKGCPSWIWGTASTVCNHTGGEAVHWVDWLYQQDLSWYRCHGGWTTFITIFLGGAALAAGVAYLGIVAPIVVSIIGDSEGEVALQLLLHTLGIYTPAGGLIGSGLAAVDFSATDQS